MSYSSSLKIVATCYPETFVGIRQNIENFILEEKNPSKQYEIRVFVNSISRKHFLFNEGNTYVYLRICNIYSSVKAGFANVCERATNSKYMQREIRS
jgi:hypothetical protein